MDYDNGSMEVMVMASSTWENWHDRQHVIQPWFERHLRSRSEPTNVQGLINRSNLRQVFDEAVAACVATRRVRFRFTLNFQIQRTFQPNGRATAITFSTPQIQHVGADEDTVEAITLQRWLRLAITRLQAHPPGHFTYGTHSLNNAILQVLQRWESALRGQGGGIADDEFYMMQQIDAWVGSTSAREVPSAAAGGTRARGRRRIPPCHYKQIARGDFDHYKIEYLAANEDQRGAVIESWLRRTAQHFEAAAGGLDRMQDIVGESGGGSVPVQPEDRGAARTLLQWRESRRTRVDAFLHYVCQATGFCPAAGGRWDFR